MTATATERQPLVHFIGRAVADPAESKTGAATVVRYAVSDGFGDDATTTFYDVVSKKDVIREAMRAHIQQGTMIAVTGTVTTDNYNPEKPKQTIWPVQIFLAQNIKSLPVDEDF